jgi:hypothetical protein
MSKREFACNGADAGGISRNQPWLRNPFITYYLNDLARLWIRNRSDEPDNSGRPLDFPTISSPLIRRTPKKLLCDFLTAVVRKTHCTSQITKDRALSANHQHPSSVILMKRVLIVFRTDSTTPPWQLSHRMVLVYFPIYS